jgi:hypothetical protein
LIEGGEALAIDGVGELAAPERGLLLFHSNRRKLLITKA